jgi:hypothetical protein
MTWRRFSENAMGIQPGDTVSPCVSPSVSPYAQRPDTCPRPPPRVGETIGENRKTQNRESKNFENRKTTKREIAKRKLSVDHASISFAERFEFAPKSLVRSCAIAVQGNDVSHLRKQCPYEATTATWLNSLGSEERTLGDTMNPASEAG